MIYLQSNDARANELLAFTAELKPAGRFPTGGRGTGMPHLPSQGSVALDGDRVLVANAGSDDVSLFTLEGDLVACLPAGGARPVSISIRGDRAYVLNAATPNVAVLSLPGGRVEATYPLPDGADPAQVAVTPGGDALVVTDRATNALIRISPADGAVTSFPSAGATPYGFDFAGDALVVTEAFGGAVGAAAASSYHLNGGIEPVSPSVANMRSEVCWAVASADGRHVWVTNFGDGTISHYAVDADGTLRLVEAVAATTVEGAKGIRDAARSRDGEALYALDADARTVFAYRIGADGALECVGTVAGLPETTAGLAAA